MLSSSESLLLEHAAGEHRQLPRWRTRAGIVLVATVVIAALTLVAWRSMTSANVEDRLIAVPSCVPNGLPLFQNERATEDGARLPETTGDSNAPYFIGYSDPHRSVGVGSVAPVTGDYPTEIWQGTSTVTLRSGVVAQAVSVDPPSEDNSSGLIWPDRRGLIVAVSGRNVDFATLIQMANTVRFVTERQWRDELTGATPGQIIDCP